MKCLGSIKSQICIKCAKGYYIHFDHFKWQNCKKCSDQNCINCIGTKSKDICISCENSCELIKGKCEKIKNVIKAIYKSNDNENILLIRQNYQNRIIKEKIDNKTINSPLFEYLFQSIGEHEVIFYINLENFNSLNKMFYQAKNLISISFINFDFQNITDISFIFSLCSSLTSFDFSNFNTKNLKDASYMFTICSSLISVNTSNLMLKK